MYWQKAGFDGTAYLSKLVLMKLMDVANKAEGGEVEHWETSVDH